MPFAGATELGIPRKSHSYDPQDGVVMWYEEPEFARRHGAEPTDSMKSLAGGDSGILRTLSLTTAHIQIPKLTWAPLCYAQRFG